MLFKQKVLLGLFFILIFTYSLVEVYDEFSDFMLDGDNYQHALMEIIVVFISFFGFSYFLFVVHAQNKNQKKLEENLKKVRKDLESSNIRLKRGKEEYQKVIEWQFAEWRLSPSEKEVALLILKGLGIKEIANSRNTQEKTVRKQASAVYEKSKLAGRHELSAWFFENML